MSNHHHHQLSPNTPASNSSNGNHHVNHPHLPSLVLGQDLNQTTNQSNYTNLLMNNSPQPSNVSDEQAFLLLQQQRDLIEKQKEQIAMLQASIQTRLMQQQQQQQHHLQGFSGSNSSAQQQTNGIHYHPHHNQTNSQIPPSHQTNSYQHIPNHHSTSTTAFTQPNFVIPPSSAVLPSLHHTFSNQHMFANGNQLFVDTNNFYNQHTQPVSSMHQHPTQVGGSQIPSMRTQPTLLEEFDELFVDGCFEYSNTPPVNNITNQQDQLFNTALNGNAQHQQFVLQGQDVLPGTPLTTWLRIPDQDSMFYRNSYDYNSAFETSPGVLAAANSIIQQPPQEIQQTHQYPMLNNGRNGSANMPVHNQHAATTNTEKRGQKRNVEEVDEQAIIGNESKKVKQSMAMEAAVQQTSNNILEFLDVADVSVDSTSTDATNNIMHTMMASFFPTDPHKGLDMNVDMSQLVPGNTNAYALLNKLKYVNNSITIVLLNGDPIIECIKFTPKKKMTFELLSLLEVDPIVLASLTGYQYDIYLDQSLLLRYGKRSTSNSSETKQTLDAFQLFLTAQITVDGKELKEIDEYFKFKTVLKNQKALNFKIEQLGTDTRWNEQIVGTNINSKLSFDIEVKMVKPIKGITINLLLFLQQQVTNNNGETEMETLLRWNVPVLVQGSRRKKKTEKDSELKECFGERMWPLVDLQMALLNRKHAENADPEMDPGEDGYGLMDDILKTRSENVFRPIGDSVLNEIVKEAENNLCKDSNNLHALRLFEKFFQQKYFSGTSLEIFNLTRYLAAKTLNKDYMLPDVIQTTSLDGDISTSLVTPGASSNRNPLNNISPDHFSELDLNILLKLTYLYSRYEPIFKADGCNNTEKMIKYCCQIATNSQFSIKTKVFSLYRLAESEYLKLNIDKTRLSYQSLEKCNQCYFFIQRCLKEEPTMTKGDVRHIKALEASVLNLKSILLSNIHNLEHFASTPGSATEQEINDKLMSLRDIIQYKHAAFQIRGRYTPKCTSFAQICNNVAASLRVYFMLFKMTSKYTPKRAIAMLNVIKKMQSRAVTVHKQANPNTSHLAYSLYKYNLKTTDLFMLEEMKADDPNDTELDDKIEKAAADKRKSYSNYRALKDQFLGQ